MNLEGDSNNQAVESAASAPVFLRRHESEPTQGPAPAGAAVAVVAVAIAAATATAAVGKDESKGDELTAVDAAAAITTTKEPPHISTKDDDDSRQGDNAAKAQSSKSLPASSKDLEKKKKKRLPTLAVASLKRSVGDSEVVASPALVASAKKGSRKTWKKPADMPKRPLSAYNLFFRSERQLLLGVTSEPGGAPAPVTKRKHRKTHGKVSFHEMANLVSEKWKGMAKEDKLPFEALAAQEKVRYREELEQWKAKQRLVVEDAAKKASQASASASATAATASSPATSTTAERYYAAIAAATAAPASHDSDDTESESSGDEDEDDEETDDDDSTDAEGGTIRERLGGGRDRRSRASGSVSTRGTSVSADRKKTKHGDGREGRRRQHDQGEAAPSAAIVGQPHLQSLSTSPRSETAALLIAMPNAGSVQRLASAAQPGGAVGVSDPRGPGTMYAPANVTERAMRDSAILLAPHQAYGMLPRGVAPSMPMLTPADRHHLPVGAAASSAALGGVSSDRKHLRERYSVLVAEATAVRMAMHDLGPMPADAPVAPPSVLVPPRRHSEGVYPTAYYPMDMRRFSDNPQTLNLLRTAQPPPLQQVDPSQGPNVGITGNFLVDASLQPTLASQPAFQMPLGTVVGPREAAVEQAQLDVLALERAADLRRADVVRWSQPTAPTLMDLRGSPSQMWSASPLSGPLPVAASNPYNPTGIQAAQYVVPHQFPQYPQAQQQLQPTMQVYNPAYQAFVQPTAHSYPVPAGSPTAAVAMAPTALSETGAPLPPPPSHPGLPPPPPR